MSNIILQKRLVVLIVSPFRDRCSGLADIFALMNIGFDSEEAIQLNKDMLRQYIMQL